MSKSDPKWRGPSEPDVATLVQSRLVEKLADSERRHRELLRELPDIVFRLDEEGRILYANDAWATQLGHSIADITSSEVESYIIAEDRAKWTSLVVPVGETTSGG